jgi:large exoprotein involved in heme utilization and adhesion
MVQQAGVAHVITNALSHVADIHAATKRQNGQQQNQATHPTLQKTGVGKPANGRGMQLLRQLDGGTVRYSCGEGIYPRWVRSAPKG